MSNVNEKWSGYILRLERSTSEYTYGDWSNHSWNEAYEIKRGADKSSRGERIKICWIDGDEIGFTFFDEKTPIDGIGDRISIGEPKVCLRSESVQGGRNEYAYSRSDYVALKLERLERLERLESTENTAEESESQTDDVRWTAASELFDTDNKAGFEAWLGLCGSGHARAADSVAYCCQCGFGTEKDSEPAIDYYKLAISLGYPSYHSLGQLYLEHGREDEARDVLLSGARANDAKSYGALSLLHPNGVENGYVAAYLASRAFELDEKEGVYLAMCYLDGAFLPVVYPYAKYCLERSSFSKADLEKRGIELPDFWDKIEEIEPRYPEFALTLDTCQEAPDPAALHIEGLSLLYGEVPNEVEGFAAIRLAAECGYSPAIITAFSRDLDGYLEMLELGAFECGDLECIEALAVELGENVCYYRGNAKLNIVGKLWSLREKLHGHKMIENAIVTECSESFRKAYAEMVKAEENTKIKKG